VSSDTCVALVIVCVCLCLCGYFPCVKCQGIQMKAEDSLAF